jgi:hypothetical protein
MKKYFLLIGLGSINLIHGLLHLLQFIQSVLLVSNSVSDKDSWIDGLFHNPIFSIIWALVGLLTLIIGIRDFRHHRHHKD